MGGTETCWIFKESDQTYADAFTDLKNQIKDNGLAIEVITIHPKLAAKLFAGETDLLHDMSSSIKKTGSWNHYFGLDDLVVSTRQMFDEIDLRAGDKEKDIRIVLTAAFFEYPSEVDEDTRKTIPFSMIQKLYDLPEVDPIHMADVYTTHIKPIFDEEAERQAAIKARQAEEKRREAALLRAYEAIIARQAEEEKQKTAQLLKVATKNGKISLYDEIKTMSSVATPDFLIAQAEQKKRGAFGQKNG